MLMTRRAASRLALLAFAALTIGHLNILTVTFVPMLVGLAIDFGVHLITLCLTNGSR